MVTPGKSVSLDEVVNFTSMSFLVAIEIVVIEDFNLLKEVYEKVEVVRNFVLV